METQPELARPKTVAASVAAFGLFILASSIVLAFLLDAFTLDLVAVGTVISAVALWDGQSWSVKALRFMMGWYVIVALAILVGCVVKPTDVKVGSHAIAEHQLLWVMGFALLLGLWAVANFIILGKLRRKGVDRAPPTASHGE
jgi:hypothetical protein